MVAPVASFDTLRRPDGSATCSAYGYTVIGAVNGPVEVSRRDELPEEAAIEVNIRPAIGVGTTRERHLESILEATLRRVILTANFPRTLIQLTLQVLSVPEDTPKSYRLNPSSSLLVLPVLLNTALLALLSAALPLETTYTATLVAVISSNQSQGMVGVEKQTDLSAATSLHAFAFTADGGLLVAESEGDFDFDSWSAAHGKARNTCCKNRVEKDMEVEESKRSLSNMHDWLVGMVTEKTDQEQSWRR